MFAWESNGSERAKGGIALALSMRAPSIPCRHAYDGIVIAKAGVPIKAKTGAGEKQAQISLSYLLNKNFRKVGPTENEGNTHLLVVGW